MGCFIIFITSLLLPTLGQEDLPTWLFRVTFVDTLHLSPGTQGSDLLADVTFKEYVQNLLSGALVLPMYHFPPSAFAIENATVLEDVYAEAINAHGGVGHGKKSVRFESLLTVGNRAVPLSVEAQNMSKKCMVLVFLHLNRHCVFSFWRFVRLLSSPAARCFEGTEREDPYLTADHPTCVSKVGKVGLHVDYFFCCIVPILLPWRSFLGWRARSARVVVKLDDGWPESEKSKRCRRKVCRCKIADVEVLTKR